MKKLFLSLFSVLVFCISFVAVQAQANIENSNNAANLEVDNTDVLFVCNGCDVEVSDAEIEGNIWGESLGWVNLQPSDGGVSNTRTGQVSGNAWGATAGWVDFSGVSINPFNGQFSGTAVSQNRGEISFECPGSSCVITTWRPLGCTDPEAENYDSTATVEDGSCTYVPVGCTDPEAENYDPIAEEDDGSCVFPEGGGGNDPVVSGCTDPEAENYNINAEEDDGSCVFCEGLECVDIYGCTNPLAENYDPNAALDNGQCALPGGDGCTNPAAENYDPDATIDDGSCDFEDSEDGEIIIGCTNPLALNYNPNTTDSDPNSCLFGVPATGCTNPLASNYNPNAQTDNGGCVLENDNGTDFGEGDSNDNNDSSENDSNPISDFVDDVVSGLPSGLTGGFLQVHDFVVQESPLLKLLTLTLLAASLLQIIPIREGNLLLSLFGFYTTKKYWGTVYDSVTKQPLDPAYVTLFDDAGQVIDTSITDIDGRYNFIVGPGTYYLSAQKTDYLFPSKKLSGKNYDELYAHLYFGGPVEVRKNDEVLSLNIPMDPLNFNWNEYAKRQTKVTHFYRPWHRFLSVAAHVLFVLGFALSVWVFVVDPTVLSFIVFSLYIITIILRLIGFRYIPRGYVGDTEGFALSYGIVRVYSAELSREVKHAIIAPEGHYLLLVPNGRYFMTVEQKLPSGEYKKVHTTKPFKVHKGFIAKKITIKPQGTENDAIIK